MMLVAMVLRIALAVGVVWLVVTHARGTSGTTGARRSRPSAPDLPDARRARGDISPDEYRERLAARRERDQPA